VQQENNMHAGTIEWNGADLSRIGKPRLSIRRKADPPAPAMATRTLVELELVVELEALDPGTLQARAQWLAESLRVSEGILRIGSGSGHVLEWLASPGDCDLAEAITGLSNRVTLGFSAVEPLEDLTDLTMATFTPAGSTTPLHLHAVRDLKEEIRTARHAERHGARSATTTSLSFTARVAQSNAADPHAERLAYLQAQALAVKALDTREGVMVIGETNAIVRVTEFTPLIDEGRGTLDVQVQCYHVVLPDAATAECLYEIDTRADEGTGELVISVKGEIAAETRVIALAKLTALRNTQLALVGQRVVSYSSADKIIDGHDVGEAEGDDWTGALTFSIEVRKARAGGHGSHRLVTDKDVRGGMKWSYSGTVRAESEAAALVAARAIASAAAHPVMTKSQETLERVTDIEAPTTLHPVKLDYSYEFEGPSDGFISGEFTTDRATPLAGEWRRSISGFLIATTQAVAEARLTILLAGESPQLEVTRRWSEIYLEASGTDATPKRVFMRLDFTCGVREMPTRASVEFTDSTQTSIAALRQTRTLAGTVWSNSEANANAALGTFYTLLLGSAIPQESVRTHAKLQYAAPGTVNSLATGGGGGTQWIKLDFSATMTTVLTGVTGYDLLEASMSMSRDGSLNATIITPIPFGRPVAQPGTGYIPGRIQITASAKAINLGTARAWVQGKRALVDAIGSNGVTRHETDQPRESATPEYAPFNGTVAGGWGFSGNYGWTFTGNVLDGVWTSGLPG
jgi:hypothetical protein